MMINMTFRAVLRGYLLEEALAWLSRNAGYRLLAHEDQDPEELGMKRGGLCVRGRGADHQVDVLGEFSLTPAFSLPVRLFMEAKFYSKKCGLDVVRNAHGVIHDVNENFVCRSGSRPRRRYQYAYALFSASGFTKPAQDYALAQQISLVDLSGPSFAWIRAIASDAAHSLYQAIIRSHIGSFPVDWMRQAIRSHLGTETSASQNLDFAFPSESEFRGNVSLRDVASQVISRFVTELRVHEESEMLFAFPAAPYFLALASDDLSEFLAYARRHPAHAISLHPGGSATNREWSLTPRESPGSYLLTFTLPERVQDWISENQKWEDKRAHQVKMDHLSSMTVYRTQEHGVDVYQLRYEPGAFAGGR